MEGEDKGNPILSLVWMKEGESFISQQRTISRTYFVNKIREVEIFLH